MYPEDRPNPDCLGSGSGSGSGGGAASAQSPLAE
jgi:hypothetical protein